MASILAKVSRDKILDKTSLKYPKYNFEKHKGY
jgi:ribonuclease HII